MMVDVVGTMAGETMAVETIEEITDEHLLHTNHTLPELELVVLVEITGIAINDQIYLGIYRLNRVVRGVMVREGMINNNTNNTFNEEEDTLIRRVRVRVRVHLEVKEGMAVVREVEDTPVVIIAAVGVGINLEADSAVL